MQRKATKNTRGPTSDEKRFLKWVKEQPCVACGHPAPSIADHCFGATFRHSKVLIGHWFVIPLCEFCDSIKTLGSRREFVKRYGNHSTLWCSFAFSAPVTPPRDVYEAIIDWNK